METIDFVILIGAICLMAIVQAASSIVEAGRRHDLFVEAVRRRLEE